MSKHCECCEDWEWDDWLLGRAVCNDCGRRWYLTPEQIKRVEAAQQEFDAWLEAEMERGRPCIRCGNDLDTTPGGPVCSVTDEQWAKDLDDGIPF